jgi:ATP-dependent DNA helicase DinG
MSRALELLGEGGAVARRLHGYERRPQQLQLAAAAERAIAAGRHLIAEAGTGVGKSFAYLLPAVLHAAENPEQGPVVVSTRTIALQEQLEHKDLPFLAAVLPIEFSVVSAVGRNHYVCLRRMHLAEREQHLFEDPERREQLQRIVGWSVSTREGLRMDLPFPVLPEVWEEVQAEHGNCLHRACTHYEVCHYQRSRRRMQTAQVLIVNHALYMADLALRMAGASYLPEHRVVVFDEAHHLERVATESLGLRLSESAVGWHLRRLHPKRAQRSLLRDHCGEAALLRCEEVRKAGAAFFEGLAERMQEGADGDGLALDDAVLDDPLSGPLQELAQEVTAASLRAQELDVRMELQARAQGLDGLAGTVAALCRPGALSESGGLVRWIERDKQGAVLRGAPLSVRSALGKHLFGSGRTAVLTSATLGPVDDAGFTWFRDQLGIERGFDVLRLGSPFDYRAQVQLIVEEAMPDPGREPDAFAREAIRRCIGRVLENGGAALCLCTSWAFVHRLADAMREPLAEAGIELLVQGQAPLVRLLQRKLEAPTSVLVGTDSLWEGIDLPGEACTLVVLTRLPFPSPGHPLTRARLRAIEAEGGDGFAAHTLPEAIVRFRQGFGRLIRSGTDRGKVVVLDPRARTRPYGRRFLGSLPAGLES